MEVTERNRLRLYEARMAIMAHEMDVFRTQDSRELVANIHPALDRWADVLRLAGAVPLPRRPEDK